MYGPRHYFQIAGQTLVIFFFKPCPQDGDGTERRDAQRVRREPLQARPLHPGLKPIVRCRMRAESRLVQRLPLAARAQHVENRIRTGAIRDAWASAAKTMEIDANWQQRLEHSPQLIRNPKTCRGPIIRCALP